MGKIFRLHLFTVVLLLAIPTFAEENPVVGEEDGESKWTDFWIVRLGLNLLGYASIIVPAWLVIRYVRSSGYLERGGEENGMGY